MSIVNHYLKDPPLYLTGRTQFTEHQKLPCCLETSKAGDFYEDGKGIHEADHFKAEQGVSCKSLVNSI